MSQYTFGPQFAWKPIESSGAKYLREIVPVNESGLIDVYSVIEAFGVTCPARAHAIKKLLCAGIRGKNNALSDLSESIDAIRRAIEMEISRNGQINSDVQARDETQETDGDCIKDTRRAVPRI